MDAAAWDQRYSGQDLIWSAEPNRWVAESCGSLPVGRALDLAAGEGRNGIWLAGLGWSVTAVDFSAVAIGKGRRLAAAQGEDIAGRIDWVVADALEFRPQAGAYSLAIIAYLQLPAAQRRIAVRCAASAVGAGGRLLVTGHDARNLAEGSGGPQDPAVLFGPDDLVGDLEGTGLSVVRADSVRRAVEGQRDAIDALVIAERPAAGQH